MKVREELNKELNKILNDINKKIVLAPGLSVNEMLDEAVEQGVFDENAYVYTKDEPTLYEMLNYSLGLCHLWAEYKKNTPDAPLTDLNKCIIKYMRDMWGLERRFQWIEEEKGGRIRLKLDTIRRKATVQVGYSILCLCPRKEDESLYETCRER